MSHRKHVEEIRKEEERLPGWLWFFLILPLTLVVALLYRYRRDLNSSQPARYSEPDSIPLDMDAVRSSGSTASYPSGISPAANFEAEEDVAVTRSSQEITMPAAGENTPPPAQTEQMADDLKIVEGIGPSISGILNDRGISTYRQLAETPVESSGRNPHRSAPQPDRRPHHLARTGPPRRRRPLGRSKSLTG